MVSKTMEKALIALQSSDDSNYPELADWIIKHRIKSKLQLRRELGVHYNKGAEKVWDFRQKHLGEFERPVQHALQQANIQQRPQFTSGYIVRAKRYGYPESLHANMKAISTKRAVFFVNFQDGQITRVRRV